jgi:hypothetical protein
MGSIFLGDGFVLNKNEADSIKHKPNDEFIFPLLNGQELNSDPKQSPSRFIINLEAFKTAEEAEEACPELVERLRKLVLPSRLAQKNEAAKQKWWKYYRYNKECYAQLNRLGKCFTAARTTKHLSFSSTSKGLIFTDAVYGFTTDRWDLFSTVQSGIHEIWARKYSGALKQDLRYSPSNCFETFPFPEGLWQASNQTLTVIGESYHDYRRALMLRLWLGLTDIYNLFHNRNLTPATVVKVSGKPEEAEAGYRGILELRKLHRKMDEAVLASYGWTDLNLGHDFHEVETLPENDRVRYTISPEARKELLKRLLALNHQRAAEEKAKVPTKAEKAVKGKASKGKKAAADEPWLFG